MKLYYILNSPLPTTKAHGLQVISMCDAFVANSTDCELILPDRNIDPTIKEADIFKFYGARRVFKITKLASLDSVEWQQIPILGRVFFWLQQISFGLSVRRYLAGRADAVVYSRDPFVLYLLKNYRTPLFWEAHGLPNKIEGFLYKAILGRIDGLIVITNKLSELFAQYYHKPILVAHDAVDVGEFNFDISRDNARQQLSLPVDKKLAMYVGHIYKWKGGKELLESVRYLGPETLLTIVGGTEDDLARARELVSAEELNRISIIPHASHRLIPLYLKAADVLLLTGNGKDPKALYYTSPMKMFEYMASGRPIVAQDLPSFREILDEKCAFIVPAGDAKKLADGIKRALSGQETGEQLARNALEKVSKMTWGSRARSILGYIQEKLG